MDIARNTAAWQMPRDDYAATRPFWQLVHILWLSKWSILIIAILGGLLVGIVGLSRPVLYEAKAQLITSSQSFSIGPGNTTISQESINEAIDSHLTRLVSQAQLRRAIKLLEDHGEDATLGALRSKGARGGMVSTITETLRKWTVQLQQAFQFDGQSASVDDMPVDKDADLLAALRSGLRVGQELRSRVISVGFTDTNRVYSSVVANAVAQAYVGQLTLQSRASVQSDLSTVNQRIPAVQRDLATAIEKKEKYLITTRGSGPIDANAVSEEAAQLKKLIIVTKANLAAAISASAGVDDQNVKIDGLLPSTASGGTQETYGPGREVQFFETQIASLEKRIKLLQATAGDAANRVSGLQALELEVDSASSQYKDILAKRESLQQRVEAPTPGVSILSAAWAPVDPKTISPIFLIPPGMILFGLLAAIAAVIRSSFEESIRSDKECEQALGIHCAGMLPKLKRSNAAAIQRIILQQPNSPYRRALSAIFVSLTPHHANANFSKVVLVTSGTQNDRKAELAWSLAVSARRFGHKTLLIDFDPKEDPLTTSFRHEFARTPTELSFADFAEGRCTAQDASNTLQDVGIDFMSAPPASSDLLARMSYADFQQSFDALRQDYNFLIINGPNSNEAPEVRVLASQADAVLLAVRWAKTKRSIVRAALYVFTRDNGDASIISSVVTDVEPKQLTRYQYGTGAAMLGSNL